MKSGRGRPGFEASQERVLLLFSGVFVVDDVARKHR